MTRVYVADALPEERSALRLLLLDLKMEVVGEAADWFTLLANAPVTQMDMLLVDRALLPVKAGKQALALLRTLCPNATVIVLLSQIESYEQATLLFGSGVFISKGELPDRVAQRLRLAAASISQTRSGIRVEPEPLALSIAHHADATLGTFLKKTGVHHE